MRITRKNLDFIFKRLQSLTGLFLLIFLFEHLFINSQASLWLGKGNGFVRTVNFLQSFLYLRAIEITLLGIPFLVHIIWGIQILFTSENNAKDTDGTKPSLKQYKRNKAYHWQRLTSIFIGVFLVFHVVQMRFVNQPKKVNIKNASFYLVKIKEDKKLKHLIEGMNAQIYTKKELDNLLDANIKIRKNQKVALTHKSGQAFLLLVRDTFKNPYMAVLYTLFVTFASFHAINGLWTFLISWGFIISYVKQKMTIGIFFWLMVILLTLGLNSIWSSFLY